MPRLLDAIDVVPDEVTDPEPEDIFAAALGTLFPDDQINSHGDSASTIIYKSARYGEIKLRTADPVGKQNRGLFAHYLWNASIMMAELMSRENDTRWSVKGEMVLEIGAGVALAGIVATLAQADEVCITDYPTPVVLENIRRNVASAVPAALRARCLVEGYQWGDVSSPFAQAHAGRFTRILAADCFWMPAEHDNLVTSMLHFLDPRTPDSRVFAVAGFHTGRAKLAAFFTAAEAGGLAIEEIYEEDGEGRRRAWEPERGAENVSERKRWQVIARLRRADGDGRNGSSSSSNDSG